MLLNNNISPIWIKINKSGSFFTKISRLHSFQQLRLCKTTITAGIIRHSGSDYHTAPMRAITKHYFFSILFTALIKALTDEFVISVSIPVPQKLSPSSADISMYETA